MERVGVLVNKLQEQLQQQAEAHKMLITAQMLYTELLTETQNGAGYNTSKVSVVVPSNPPLYNPNNGVERKDVEQPAAVPEPPKPIEAQANNCVTDSKDVASTFVYDGPSKTIASTWNLASAEIPTLPPK
jgi:patatin-like phospholipase/acyl hydrolase